MAIGGEQFKPGGVPESALSSSVQTKLNSGGGIPAWSLILKGFIANSQADTKVGDAVVGKEYAMVVFISQPGSNFVSGDENAPSPFSLTEAVTPLDGFDLTGLTGVPQEAVTRIVHLLAIGSGTTPLQGATASTFGAPDTCAVRLLQNGEFHVQHIDNGDGSNGIYQIYER